MIPYQLCKNRFVVVCCETAPTEGPGPKALLLQSCCQPGCHNNKLDRPAAALLSRAESYKSQADNKLKGEVDFGLNIASMYAENTQLGAQDLPHRPCAIPMALLEVVCLPLSLDSRDILSVCLPAMLTVHSLAALPG